MKLPEGATRETQGGNTTGSRVCCRPGRALEPPVERKGKKVDKFQGERKRITALYQDGAVEEFD